ncbi:MAG TPA: ABC transporter ATP-binding protein [Terriglobales bacterium]|nr:ABC transporter ATP-binding protein [Terriglobales bacterium]
MGAVIFESVSKAFRHRPALFNWIAKERAEPTVALRDISFRVQSGSVLALLGPNGSGKTTLLKLISTIFLPDRGRVIVHGADTLRYPLRVRRCVGFAVAGERSFFPRLTALENLDFFAALDDVPPGQRKARIECLLARTGLLDAADTLVMKFSAGMYQRLAIARALLKEPAVLLLDEPTRSLDPAVTADMWDLVHALSANGTTVVIATHNFQEAATVADFVAVLQRGELVAHAEIQGFNAQDVRSLYFQNRLDVATNDFELVSESCR